MESEVYDTGRQTFEEMFRDDLATTSVLPFQNKVSRGTVLHLSFIIDLPQEGVYVFTERGD